MYGRLIAKLDFRLVRDSSPSFLIDAILGCNPDEIFDRIDLALQLLDKEGLVRRLILGQQGLHFVQVRLPTQDTRAQIGEPDAEIVAMEILLDVLYLIKELVCKMLAVLPLIMVEKMSD